MLQNICEETSWQMSTWNISMIWDDAIKRDQTEIFCEAGGERERLGQHLASDGLTYKQAYRST